MMLPCMGAWIPISLHGSQAPVCTAALRRRTCPGYSTMLHNCLLMLLYLGARVHLSALISQCQGRQDCKCPQRHICLRNTLQPSLSIIKIVSNLYEKIVL